MIRTEVERRRHQMNRRIRELLALRRGAGVVRPPHGQVRPAGRPPAPTDELDQHEAA